MRFRHGTVSKLGWRVVFSPKSRLSLDRIGRTIDQCGHPGTIFILQEGKLNQLDKMEYLVNSVDTDVLLQSVAQNEKDGYLSYNVTLPGTAWRVKPRPSYCHGIFFSNCKISVPM